MQYHWSFSLIELPKARAIPCSGWPDTVDGYGRHIDGKYQCLGEDNVTISMVCFGARRFTHQRYRVPLPGDAVIVRKSFSLIFLYNDVHITYLPQSVDDLKLGISLDRISHHLVPILARTISLLLSRLEKHHGPGFRCAIWQG